MKYMRIAVLAIASIFIFSSCSTTQKTEGQGMVSVIAQNVVRIAGAKAVRDLDISEVDGKGSFVDVTGFVDSFNQGFIRNLIRDEVEAAGGRLLERSDAELIVEVAVNSAGNDRGSSGYVIGGAERTEGGVDLTVTIRDLASGQRLTSQAIRGQAKYQQGTLLGISGSGAYFVMDDNNWDLVEDPARYK
jgi:hypothetical protein